jgi:Flp pilus assembly protein TadG
MKVSGRYSFRRRPSGQFAVILSLLIVVLIGAMALTTDVSVVYYRYISLQGATDAAALAGANYLPSQTADATKTANSYALLNGVLAGEIKSITVGPDGSTITVATTRSVPALFSRVLGLSQFTVSASAVASSQPAGSNVGGVLPVGLDARTAYQNGQAITMHQGNNNFGPGNWGGLALGGTGGALYESNLATGYSGTVSIGDTINTEPGAKAGPTQEGVNAKLTTGAAFDPNATASEHQLNDPRAVTVPLMDWAGANGTSPVKVVGFAEVWLTGVAGTNISAVFIAQGVSGGASPGAPNAGAFHVALIQ